MQIVVNSPFGRIELQATDSHLTHCCWTKKPLADYHKSPILQQAKRQLDQYFSHQRTHFDLPVALSGTTFQIKVWQALSDITYGKTWSYKQLAHYIGHHQAARAVGSANAKNPLAIIIPCHRVIHASGVLGGYNGGVVYKQQLLALEGVAL